MSPASQLEKSLAEFADFRRQIKWNHFLSGRVPDRKYFSGCKCAPVGRARSRLQKFVGKARQGFPNSSFVVINPLVQRENPAAEASGGDGGEGFGVDFHAAVQHVNLA